MVHLLLSERPASAEDRRRRVRAHAQSAALAQRVRAHAQQQSADVHPHAEGENRPQLSLKVARQLCRVSGRILPDLLSWLLDRVLGRCGAAIVSCRSDNAVLLDRRHPHDRHAGAGRKRDDHTDAIWPASELEVRGARDQQEGQQEGSGDLQAHRVYVAKFGAEQDREHVANAGKRLEPRQQQSIDDGGHHYD